MSLFLEIINRKNYTDKFKGQEKRLLMSDKYKESVKILKEKFFDNNKKLIIIPYLSGKELKLNVNDRDIIKYLQKHDYKVNVESYKLGICYNEEGNELSIFNALSQIRADSMDSALTKMKNFYKKTESEHIKKS